MTLSAWWNLFFLLVNHFIFTTPLLHIFAPFITWFCMLTYVGSSHSSDSLFFFLFLQLYMANACSMLHSIEDQYCSLTGGSSSFKCAVGILTRECGHFWSCSLRLDGWISYHSLVFPFQVFLWLGFLSEAWEKFRRASLWSIPKKRKMTKKKVQELLCRAVTLVKLFIFLQMVHIGFPIHYTLLLWLI